MYGDSGFIFLLSMTHPPPPNMTGYNGGGNFTSLTTILTSFIPMTGDIIVKPLKKFIRDKKKKIGPQCLYHDKPLSWHPYKKKWECQLCIEEERDEQILQGGYTD